MFDKDFVKQLTKFLIVGASNTALSYIVFFISYNYFLSKDAFYSQCLSYSAGIIWSFFWNNKWTFSKANKSWSAFYPFLILQLFLLLISAFLLDIAKAQLNLSINLIWLGVMVVITILNFFLTKHLVFKR
ncbi:GtrA family protein [Colwellia sp. 1_MG-2023]|uniref:GtrA family protein n=1 Tax=Colwellia sp. 1_MG-2023 TaxID=3062649 RepID=UPI0026E276B5|nr:GtrA family protein [Colwellia sp. 1_MG-2023]MDO6444983.1 GtrA family protein [Colwellia sp. 1_MG-2023]